jgi:molybdopterin synthase catalytic subunit
MKILVQIEPFDLNLEVAALHAGKPAVGAVAAFVGLVRDTNPDATAEPVNSLTLEHYPGMTERSLERIVQQASERWSLIDATVIHRVGELLPTDPIVLVAVAAAHRGEAFEACQFIMDYLKTEAPFWKKERGPDGSHWVEARHSDASAAARWGTGPR